ncbi:hypothetical protein SEVIR_5G264300v4 [Setaria viridis]|uniref:Uncharacterized protein n=1 Tax=Setaria viridis TaxID=4556 RepID=A0A4U6UI28_SETVI|nr:hypothetical protein SEVIR_5G264300v2 [Setaria viridis]
MAWDPHPHRQRPASLSTSRRLLPACMDSVRPAWQVWLWSTPALAGVPCGRRGRLPNWARNSLGKGALRAGHGLPAGLLGGCWLHFWHTFAFALWESASASTLDSPLQASCCFCAILSSLSCLERLAGGLPFTLLSQEGSSGRARGHLPGRAIRCRGTLSRNSDAVVFVLAATPSISIEYGREGNCFHVSRFLAEMFGGGHALATRRHLAFSPSLCCPVPVGLLCLWGSLCL